MDISLRLGLSSLATMGGGGGGGFTPLDLGASLIAWWTADRSDLITLSGAQVSSWKDVVGGYDVTQAVAGSRPIYSSTGFGGSPGLTYDGTDDMLTGNDASMLLALPDGAEPGEIWSIVQQDALVADTTQRIAACYGNTATTNRSSRRAVITGANRARTNAGDGVGSTNNNDSTIDLSSRHVIRSIFTATDIATQVDGGSVSTPISVVAATTNSSLRLGANTAGSGSLYWQGPVRDFLFTGPLSAEQANLLTAWAMARRAL